MDGATGSENDLPESSVKDEPLSPTSSISSRISESGSKRGQRTRGMFTLFAVYILGLRSYAHSLMLIINPEKNYLWQIGNQINSSIKKKILSLMHICRIRI